MIEYYAARRRALAKQRDDAAALCLRRSGFYAKYLESAQTSGVKKNRDYCARVVRRADEMFRAKARQHFA